GRWRTDALKLTGTLADRLATSLRAAFDDYAPDHDRGGLVAVYVAYGCVIMATERVKPGFSSHLGFRFYRDELAAFVEKLEDKLIKNRGPGSFTQPVAMVDANVTDNEE